MTVAELIAALQKLPGELPVKIISGYGKRFGKAAEVYDVSTKNVFPADPEERWVMISDGR